MHPEPLPSGRVLFSARFLRDLRSIKKKYRHVRDDIQPVIDRLEANESLGDRIPAVGQPVFKVRVQNTDIGKGKSSGYRLIYWKKPSDIILVPIYSKLNQADISATEIARFIKECDAYRAGPEPSTKGTNRRERT